MPALAAVEAGVTRFRPVLMTALAMIIGMAPMALGLGEGGEQNAPLGRAVIGGLHLRHLRHTSVRARRVQHHPRQTGAPHILGSRYKPRSDDRRSPCLIKGIFWNIAPQRI